MGLRHLNLDSCSVGGKGAQSFAYMLRKNKDLRILDLRYNGIGTDGAKALLAALPDNDALVELNLQGNPVPMKFKDEFDIIANQRRSATADPATKESDPDVRAVPWGHL